MSLIGKILAPENVILDMDVASKKRVFEQVGLLIENSFGIARSDIYGCLFEREKLGSTGLGQGIAIPHGRARGLKEVVGVFIRLKTPIPFDAPVITANFTVVSFMISPFASLCCKFFAVYIIH